MDIQDLQTRHPAHWQKAAAIRTLTLDAVRAANSGHSGMPMGMADVATVLFENHLKFDATAPNWQDRDRFILSAGHGSMLIYSLLHLTGYADMTIDQVRNFRQWGAITAGHPEYGHATGVEVTTGPLGQGIANSVGFAMAEEIQRARYGAKIVDHIETGRIYLDGSRLIGAYDGVVLDRIRMATRGTVAISLVIEGTEVLGVWAEPIGLPETEVYEDGLVEIIEEQVENTLLKSKAKLLKDDHEVEKLVSKVVTSVCKNEIGKKPITRILINRLES